MVPNRFTSLLSGLSLAHYARKHLLPILFYFYPHREIKAPGTGESSWKNNRHHHRRFCGGFWVAYLAVRKSWSGGNTIFRFFLLNDDCSCLFFAAVKENYQ